MELDIIHIPQGSFLHLLSGEKEYLSKSFETRGISLGSIDYQQDIVSFPQGYVGYICLPTRKIIIDPKHEGIDLRHILRIYYFLYGSEATDLDDPIYDVDKGRTYDLIDLYLNELDKVIKKGLPVEYREGRECLSHLRGNANVFQTLMNKKLGKRDLFDCSFDELTKDIEINQVLFKAYQKVSKIVDLGKASMLEKDFVDISNIYKIPDINLNTNTMYCKKAVTLAYMILNDLSISDYGNQVFGQNFLINFDKVFEDFVKKILVSYSGDYNFSYWDDEKKYAICISTNCEDYTKSYIPDMLYMYQDKEVPTSAFGIFDVKNKTSKPFSNADVYQMFFYANQLHSKRVVLCYPSSEEQDNATLKFDNEYFSLKKIFGVYINIAGNSSSEFKRNIYSFIDRVRNLL